MNSEQLRIMQELEIQKPDKTDMKASKVVHDILELQEMPGWKVLVQDLGGIKDGLMKALLDAKTLGEARMLQVRIKDIDLFMNTPTKYIKQSKTYLNRRDKWQKK